MAEKLKAKAPKGYVYCKDSWKHTNICPNCKKAKKCVIFKSYQEAQVDGENVEKGKSNKDK